MVIDYTQQDFTSSAAKYDLIFDVVGNRSLSECQSVLQPEGIYVTTQPYPSNYLQSVLSLLWPGQKYKVILLKSKYSDLEYLTAQIEVGHIRSVIDQRYPLEKIAEAHTYAEAEHTVGQKCHHNLPVDIGRRLQRDRLNQRTDIPGLGRG